MLVSVLVIDSQIADTSRSVISQSSNCPSANRACAIVLTTASIRAGVGSGSVRVVLSIASDSITMLHEATGGALRDLDRLATACLRTATRKKRKTIERDVVSRMTKAAAASGEAT